MAAFTQLVVFSVNERMFALPLPAVMRVAPVAALTPIPELPGHFPGLLNLGGELVVVVDFRRRIGLPARPVELTDQLIIVQTSARRLALRVDGVRDVVRVPSETFAAGEEIVPGVKSVEGIAKVEGGVALVWNPESLLSVEDNGILNESI